MDHIWILGWLNISSVFIFGEAKLQFLLLELICIRLPFLLIYVVHVKPNKSRQADKLASRRFSHHQQRVLSEFDNTKIADIKDVSSEASNYQPLSDEIILKVQDNDSRIELKNIGNYKRRGTSFSIAALKGLSYHC